MRRRWWNRIWIIQGIVVWKKVKLLYASMVAPWEIFVQAALCYSQNNHSSVFSSYPREYVTVLALFSRWFWIYTTCESFGEMVERLFTRF